MILTVAFLLMTAVAALFFIVPVLRAPRTDDLLPREGINTLVFRDRLAELEEDRAVGRVDEESFLQLREELERSLLADVEATETRTAPARASLPALIVVVAVLPAFGLGTYYWKGQRAAVDEWLAAQARWTPVIAASLKGKEITEEEGKDLTGGDYIRVLQAILQDDPAHAEGWRNLGVAYLQVGYPSYAELAFRHASDLVPGDVDYRLLIVEAKLAGGRGALDDAGMVILEEVLRLDARNPKARMMMGMAAFNRKDYQAAITTWQALLEDVPPDSEGASILQSSIGKAREKLQAPAETVAGPSLRVTVDIEAALLQDFPKPAFLMVYAKQVNGLPMPAAIRKLTLDHVPVTVALSDSDAMAPMAKLSTSKSVKVYARLSQTGTASPQPGDAMATSDEIVIEPGSHDVSLRIVDFVK